MADALGDRMKAYENCSKSFLPRRTYTIIRVDGRSFHSYTKSCERPYDVDLMHSMDYVALELCKEIAGAQFAFVQSDEVSVLLTDFASIHTQPWFGGNVQKIVSISAATATVAFHMAEKIHRGIVSKVVFDSRAFTIPDPVEVANCFIWRQKDATRNSISSAAQSEFNHKELHGLTSDQLQEKLWQERNINWNDYPIGFKRGRLIKRMPFIKDTPVGKVETTQWEVTEPDVFTQSDQLKELIPTYESVQEETTQVSVYS